MWKLTSLIGKVLKNTKEKVYVATKAGRRLDPHNAEGYNLKNIESFVDRSLINLGVDIIDLVQLHCPPSIICGKKETYEMMDEMRFYKGTEFTKNYTIHSARAYYINMRLESGIPPAVVGKLVGHNLKTMMKHYENINVMNLKSKIVQQRRKKLEEADFQTFDIDKYHLIKDEI